MVRYRKRNGDSVEKTLILFKNFTQKIKEMSNESLSLMFSKAVRKAYNERDKLIPFFLKNAIKYSTLKKTDRLYYTKLALSDEEAEMFNELTKVFERILGTRNKSETARRVLFYYVATNS